MDAVKFAYKPPETQVTQQGARAERNMALSRTLRRATAGLAIALSTAALVLDAAHKTDLASLTAGAAVISAADSVYYSVLLRVQRSNPELLLRGARS